MSSSSSSLLIVLLSLSLLYMCLCLMRADGKIAFGSRHHALVVIAPTHLDASFVGSGKSKTSAYTCVVRFAQAAAERQWSGGLKQNAPPVQEGRRAA